MYLKNKQINISNILLCLNIYDLRYLQYIRSTKKITAQKVNELVLITYKTSITGQIFFNSIEMTVFNYCFKQFEISLT